MFPMRVPVLLSGAIALAALCAGAARSQTDPAAASAGVIAQPQAAAAQSDSVDAQIAAWTQAPAIGENGWGGLTNGGANKDGVVEIPPREIHGEAGVSIGSSGYRSGYILTDIPIGKNSDLGIAVGESEIKPKNFGKIKDQSLAISLNIGGADNGGPINCRSPTVAMDGRYLEPVWESRLHGEALARDQMSCGSAYAPSSVNAQAAGSAPVRAAE